MGRELGRAHNGCISINCGLIKSYAGKEILQRDVAVRDTVFAIKTATRFVNQSAAEHMYVRTGESVVTNVSLSQAQSRHRLEHRSSAAHRGLRIVSAINVVLV